MNGTLKGLEVILDSVIEQLLLAGAEPGQIVAQVLRNAQRLCTRDLRELAQELISNMDEITTASIARTKDEESWATAFKSEDVDLDLYHRETTAHQNSIYELEQHGEVIEQKAMLLSKAGYRSRQIELILRDVKPIETAPDAAVRTVVDMANAGHRPDEDVLYNERLQRVLRYLVGRDRLSSADGGSLRSAQIFDWEDDMPSLDEICYWDTGLAGGADDTIQFNLNSFSDEMSSEGVEIGDLPKTC